MSIGWKIWLGVLGVVAVGGGLLLHNTASENFDLNSLQTSGAPQQAVVAQWHTNDLLTIVIFELAVAIIAVVSMAFVLIPTDGQVGPVNSIPWTKPKPQTSQSDVDVEEAAKPGDPPASEV